MHVAMLGYGSSYWDRFPDPCSGREAQVWGIAKELTRRGHEVTLVKAAERESMAMAEGVELVSLAMGASNFTIQGFQHGSMIGDALSFSKKAAMFLEEHRPDVLCLHYGLSGRYLDELAVPRTYTFHVADVMASARRMVLERDFVHYPHTAFATLMERRTAERANSLVVLNRQMGSYINRAWKRQARVIPCAVDETVFVDRGDGYYVLYVGRMEWKKNVDLLLKAYSALPSSARRSFGLKLMGAGDCEQSLRRYAGHLGIGDRVEFIPWSDREEVASVIGSCSLMVLPSLVETFGIVLIEAMACGKPVLATDTLGPRDIITPGTNGLMARSGDVRDLSSQMLYLLEDPELRGRMGHAGRAAVENMYTFRSVGGRYEETLGSLTGDAVRPAPVAAPNGLGAASAR